MKNQALMLTISLLLLAAVGGCNSLGPDVDLAFYSLTEVNDQAFEPGKESVVVGTIPYQDTICELLLRLDGGGGYAYINFNTNVYHVVTTMDLRCENVESGQAEANADERGNYTVRSGTLTFEPTEREGLELTAGTLRGDRMTIEGVIDASSLVLSHQGVDRSLPSC